MMNYPFTIREISKEEGGGYLAEAFDLNGCIADGNTPEEAMKELEDAIFSWIKTAEELGIPVPPPSTNTRFSGKWLLRTPVTLHRRLAECAKREGVSLNTFVVSLLSESIGSRK